MAPPHIITIAGYVGEGRTDVRAYILRKKDMDTNVPNLVPKGMRDNRKARQDAKETAADLKEDQAAPFEHTTLEDYDEVGTEKISDTQRAKWERELAEQSAEAEKLRHLRRSEEYDGG